MSDDDNGVGVDLGTLAPTRGDLDETASRLADHHPYLAAAARRWTRLGDVTVTPNGVWVHYRDNRGKSREAPMERTPEAFFRRAVQNVVDEWDLDVRSLHALIGPRFLRAVVLAECCDLIMDLVPDKGEVPADQARLMVDYTRFACTRTVDDAG
jgi:hypothetical protein